MQLQVVIGVAIKSEGKHSGQKELHDHKGTAGSRPLDFSNYIRQKKFSFVSLCMGVMAITNLLMTPIPMKVLHV